MSSRKPLSEIEAIKLLRKYVEESAVIPDMVERAGYLLVYGRNSTWRILAANFARLSWPNVGERTPSHKYMLVVFDESDNFIVVFVKCPDSFDGPAVGYTVYASRFELIATKGNKKELKWVGYVTPSDFTKGSMEIGSMIVEKVKHYHAFNYFRQYNVNGITIVDKDAESPSEPTTHCLPPSDDCDSEANGVRKAPD
jgi:hypothetical protein